MNRIAPSTARRSQSALVLVALVLVALLVPGAAPATAADETPVYGSFAAPGTVRTGTWTVASTRSATAPFPGDGAEVAPLSVEVLGGSDLTLANTGSATLQVVPADTATLGLGCLAGAALGDLRDCGRSGTLTLTFPRPVTDPVVKFALGSGVRELFSPGGGGCTEGWPTVRFTRVNGQPTSGDNPSILPTANPPHTWDPATKSLLPDVASLLPKSGCTIDLVDYVPVAFSGLISSIEVEVHLSAAIVIDGDLRNAPPVGALMVAPSVPVADLQVTTDAESVVDPAGQITWDVAMRNNGAGGSHGFVVRDAVPAQVTGASLVTAPTECRLEGRDLVCSNPPPRCSVSPNSLVATLLDLVCATSSRDASAVVLPAGEEFGRITLTGTAPNPRGTVVTSTARVAGVDFELDVTNNVAAVDTEVVAPTLVVGKQLDARLSPSDQFTVSAAAQGAVVTSTTTSGTDLTALSGAAQVTRGQAYTITETLADGSVSELSRYDGVLRCTDQDGVDVPVEGAGPWTFVPVENREYLCVVTNAALDRSFSVVKTASVATVQPGGTVRYELTVTGTGAGSYTATDPAVLSDDLSDVLDDAVLTGDVTGGAVVDGSTLSWSGSLAAGETRTISYEVRVNDTFTGDRTLLNTVTTPPGSGGSCPAVGPAAGCSTSTPVEGVQSTVLVEKVGDGDAGQRLAGARFEVLADEAGVPGAALTGAGGVETETGLFAFDLLAPGTYWLQEVAAPGSHALLAEPVQFTVAPSGAVRVSDPDTHPQVTVTGAGSDTLTVRDVAAFTLPSAGGSGTVTIALAGALLLLAVTAVVLHTRRTSTRPART